LFYDIDLHNTVVNAADRYWNAVSDLSIKLKKGIATNRSDQLSILVSCKNMEGEMLVVGGINNKLHFLNINNVKVNELLNMDADEQIEVIGHALGHSLGLGHSSYPNALMSPFVSKVAKELSKDDISGILFLYGN